MAERGEKDPVSEKNLPVVVKFPGALPTLPTSSGRESAALPSANAEKFFCAGETGAWKIIPGNNLKKISQRIL